MNIEAQQLVENSQLYINLFRLAFIVLPSAAGFFINQYSHRNEDDVRRNNLTAIIAGAIAGGAFDLFFLS